MKNIWNKITKHVSYFQEFYIWPLVTILLVFGAIQGVQYLSVKPVIDNPGDIVASLYLFVKLVLAGMFTVWADPHMFNDLTKQEWEKATFAEKCLDQGKTLFLFIVSVYLLFFR